MTHKEALSAQASGAEEKSRTEVLKDYFVDVVQRELVGSKGKVSNKDSGRELKTARVEVKTTDSVKERLKLAAETVGVDLSAFILSAAYERAEQVFRNEQRRLLSPEGWNLLNQAMESSDEPTLALRKLMRGPRLNERTTE